MTRGLYLGKFMPVHNGHLHVINTAIQLVDELEVLITTENNEPIEGALRNKWLQECVPKGVKVTWWCNKNLPQFPDTPNFWPIWLEELASLGKFDYVFGGEDYIINLAHKLEAEPVIIDRKYYPISGTAIRNNPEDNWGYIPDVVKSYYRKRITILGPESTGKTTLTASLTKYLNIVNRANISMHEYGRNYDSVYKQGMNWIKEDFLKIAQRHEAIRNALVPNAGPILIEDTDVIQTVAWEQALTGEYNDYGIKPTSDLYILLAPNVPWIDDGTRYTEVDRRAMFNFLLMLLKKNKLNYIIIYDTSWYLRKLKAINTINSIF